jgi:hypothetical protein
MGEASSKSVADSPASKAAPLERAAPKYSKYFCSAFVLLLIAFVGSIEPGIPPRRAWNAIESEHVLLITKAMLLYAQDHQGKFPFGKSSTEVFQKLLEGGYADYSLFYFPMKGKTPALNRQPLKPENVCFDMTGPSDSSAPDDLPLVFSTGFKVSYKPGASAKRLVPLEFRVPGFELFRPDPGPSHNCIVIGYKLSQVRTLFVTDDATNPNGSARGFIPANFNAGGKIYDQLTPDGVLP